MKTNTILCKIINALLSVIAIAAFFILTAEYPEASFFQDTTIRFACLAALYGCVFIAKRTAPDMFTEDEEI